GSKEIEAQPNILRAMLGYEDRDRDVTERVVHIETNIDDMNPQVYEYIMERLFQEGALDVYLTPIIMKKSRPGTVLNVLCPESEVELLSSIILSESTTIGLRYQRMDRICLERSIREIETEWGSVRFKVLKTPEGIKISPEYEDCKKIALREGLPILHVMKILSRVAEETVP
ncbi:MAG TPA: LarC family nickel insertion protein, partial [Nitrospirae bacterium]|nr:LarC family nickel insertion protein [Nitrospirota bacterium]